MILGRKGKKRGRRNYEITLTIHGYILIQSHFYGRFFEIFHFIYELMISTMTTVPKKRILYGNANYKEIVHKNDYFVDKTHDIEALERIEDPVFLRPRRFGKSLWCNILECYYDINQTDNFEHLFGHTYIGQNPTLLKNSYFVLHLDFSVIEPDLTMDITLLILRVKRFITQQF